MPLALASSHRGIRACSPTPEGQPSESPLNDHALGARSSTRPSTRSRTGRRAGCPLGFTGTRFDLLPIPGRTARGIKCPHDRRGSPTAGDRPRLIFRPRMAPHRATPQRRTHRYRQTRTIPRGLRIQSNPSTDTTSPPAPSDRDTHFPRALIARSALLVTRTPRSSPSRRST